MGSTAAQRQQLSACVYDSSFPSKYCDAGRDGT